MTSPHWLNARRLRVYPRILVVLFALAVVAWVVAGRDSFGGDTFFGMDFLALWSGGKLAILGRPEAAYDWQQLLAASRLGIPGNTTIFVWSYPPIAFLLMIPFALLPYQVALWLWTALSVVVFTYAMVKLVPGENTKWVALAFPGLFVNVIQGQNSAMATALLAGALYQLERRPQLAGLLIAAVMFKPQLGILIPVALVAGRYWKVLWYAILSGVALIGLSLLATSWQTALTFAENLPVASALIANGDLRWVKIPSVYISLRSLGAGSTGAYAVQAVFALLAAGVVGRHWYLHRGTDRSKALLATATLLVSYHLTDHDLVLLAIAIAYLTLDRLHAGWQRCDREILVAAWCVPILDAPVASATAFHIAPLVILTMIFVSLRPMASDAVATRTR